MIFYSYRSDLACGYKKKHLAKDCKVQNLKYIK